MALLLLQRRGGARRAADRGVRALGLDRLMQGLKGGLNFRAWIFDGIASVELGDYFDILHLPSGLSSMKHAFSESLDDFGLVMLRCTVTYSVPSRCAVFTARSVRYKRGSVLHE